MIVEENDSDVEKDSEEPKEPESRDSSPREMPPHSKRSIFANTVLIVLPILGIILVIGIISVFLFIDFSDDIKTVSKEQLISGTSLTLAINQKLKYDVNGTQAELIVESIGDHGVMFKFGDYTQNIGPSNETAIDVDNDGSYDIIIILDSVSDKDVFFRMIKYGYTFPEENNIGDNQTIPLIVENNSNPNGCVENWSCNNWSECDDQNVSIRTCFDQKKCNSVENMPAFSKSCEENVTVLSDCVSHTAYWCGDNKTVSWFNSCKQREDPKEICDSDERCDVDKCKLMSCEEFKGFPCEDKEVCSKKSVVSEDEPLCCQETCVDLICTQNAAQNAASNYYAYGKGDSYDNFKIRVSLDCSEDESECKAILKTAKDGFFNLTSFTFVEFKNASSGRYSTLKYSATLDTTNYEIGFSVSMIDGLPGCRVSSHYKTVL
ncbi:hypothetical protein GOV14_01380 [Candidatus Pacearchaeota archaeon]|nr:hypothetical protein [Candidatus Pacearchaeota archaeon]